MAPRCTFLIFALVSLVYGQTETQWKVQDFPDPIFQVEECGRSEEVVKSLICDPNKVIPEKDVNDISNILDNIYNTTRCNCASCIANKTGFLVMVAIMPRMYRLYNASNNHMDLITDARIYAYYLSTYWAENFSKCDQMVLILFSRDDGVVYTLTQRDARLKLTDELVTSITFENQKYFDTKDRNMMGKGLTTMVEQYRDVLKGHRLN